MELRVPTAHREAAGLVAWMFLAVLRQASLDIFRTRPSRCSNCNAKKYWNKGWRSRNVCRGALTGRCCCLGARW